MWQYYFLLYYEYIMILVTGGTGLLGSRLLFDLTSRGEKVRAIKRKFSNLDAVRRIFSYYSENPHELLYRIEWVDADIRNIDSVMEVMENVRLVYHAAGFVSFDPHDRETLFLNNVNGTRNIVNACLANSVKKLCHVSSTAALGAAGLNGLIDEKSMWEPGRLNSGYSASKFHSEMEVWKGIEEGLNAVIVNPSVILGAGFWDKGSSSLFPAVYKGMKFYTHGVTGFISVEDVSAAMIALMKSNRNGERYILSSENLSYKEIFEMIACSLGVREPFINATPLMTSVALAAESFLRILGRKPVLTRETIRASRNKSFFSNEKFTHELKALFQPIKPVISNISGYFIKDLQDGWLDKKNLKWANPEK